MANKETCQLFIIFPEHEDVEKTSPCVKGFSLLAPDDVMAYIDFIDRIEQRGRAEHYLLYYDSNNIRNFLYPVYEFEEYYPKVEVRLLNTLQKFAEDWREEPIQDRVVNYKLFQAPVTDDSFCEVCERKFQAGSASTDSTFAIINHGGLDSQPLASMNRDLDSVEIAILEASIEQLENWLQKNRRPLRVYNWNPKHGENGKDAHKANKTDTVAILYCSRAHAEELLHKAIGEYNDIGPLYVWDEEFKRYMEFKRESKSSTTFHSYHLEEGDRKNSSNPKIIKQMKEISEIDNEKVYDDGFEPNITKPFDPSKIKLDISTVNLLSLINELENDEINLTPDFQRATDVWDSKEKSRLIESILLGLPLPSFYFNEDEGGNTRSVIDGVQRLCAIRDFVLGKEQDGRRTYLKLEGLQFLKQYEGLKFTDLTRPDVRRIHNMKITTNTLGYETPSEVKLIIFQRVNSAGIPLTHQEMRHALNQGLPAEYIKRLSESEAFLRATYRKINRKRMQDRDFVNRFIAFYCGYNDYDGNLDVFLNDQMGNLNKYSDLRLNEISMAFEKAMDTCFLIFGEGAFRKVNRNGKFSKISKSLFDSLSVNIAWLSDSQRSQLIHKKEQVRQALRNLFQNKEFGNRLSNGTGKLPNVKYRFEQIETMLKNVLNSELTSRNLSEV